MKRNCRNVSQPGCDRRPLRIRHRRPTGRRSPERVDADCQPARGYPHLRPIPSRAAADRRRRAARTIPACGDVQEVRAGMGTRMAGRSDACRLPLVRPPRAGPAYPYPRRSRTLMAVIQPHDSISDWCHTCGTRSDQTADVWFPNAALAGGAEHAAPNLHRAGYGSPPHLTHYVRVCSDCARAILAAATGAAPGRVVRQPEKRTRHKRT